MSDQQEKTIERLKREGGPAFARGAGPEGMYWASGEPGMSLRDWFAGMVICGAIQTVGCEDLAARAYAIADAMLAERKK